MGAVGSGTMVHTLMTVSQLFGVVTLCQCGHQNPGRMKLELVHDG